MINIDELVKNTWQIQKKYFWTYSGIVALPIAVNVIAVIFMTLAGIGGFLLWSLGGGILSGILFIIIWIALILFDTWGSVALVQAIVKENDRVEVIQSFKESKHLILPYLWIGILTSLAVAAGLVLLIVPGIIFAIWFCFSSYVLVKEGTRGTKALSKSKELVKGKWWAIFSRMVVLTIIAFLISFIAGFVPVIGSFLGSVLIAPFSIIYIYLIYKDLKQPQTAVQNEIN